MQTTNPAGRARPHAGHFHAVSGHSEKTSPPSAIRPSAPAVIITCLIPTALLSAASIDEVGAGVAPTGTTAGFIAGMPLHGIFGCPEEI